MTAGNPGAVTGVVLAGGRARRMGGLDKGLVPLNGRPMIEYALHALRPQVADIVINANRNHSRYGAYGYRLIADQMGDYSGPLAGMASAMSIVTTPYVVTVPCDSPLIAPDLVERLQQALRAREADLAVAHDGQRMQPVFALLPVRLLDNLREFLAAGERKIDRWYAQHTVALADFSDAGEMFINVNTPEERDAVAAQVAPPVDQPPG
ncbi:MAG: molybdenum cofactor guanylyltransferase MobA [Gammaproteobacteria bacterium]